MWLFLLLTFLNGKKVYRSDRFHSRIVSARIAWPRFMSIREETRKLPGERDNARNNARRRGRPRTAWMDNIKTWTGLSVEESIRMTEDRDKWRKYVHDVANPRIEDG